MARPKRPGKHVRVNLDMPEDVKKRIEDLRDETHASSLAMVLQRALAVYDYIYRTEQEGARIVVHHADGNQEHLRIMP